MKALYAGLICMLVVFVGCSAAPAPAPTTPQAVAESEEKHDHDHDHDHDHPHEDGNDHENGEEEHDDHDHDHSQAIAIPDRVRANLGITFAKVERRNVASTRRVPGQFELRPEAVHEYRAMLGGRVSLSVKQFQKVNAGDELFRIDSPAWRQMQHEAVEAEGEIILAQAALDVAKAQHNEAKASLARHDSRIANLAKVNVRRADLETEASAARNSLPRLDAEIRAREAALREAHEHYASRLKALSSVTGLSVEELGAHKPGGESAWRGVVALVVRAKGVGVVDQLAVNDGGWVEEGALALSTIDPQALRFHAEAPQADIGLFRDGQKARIVPPAGSSVPLDASMDVTLQLGLTAHATDRTIPLLATPPTPVAWARAGVSGFLEVNTGDPNAEAALAIPTSALVQDGLENVFYRRDPEHPDLAVRVVAELGQSDGRWVAVKGGVEEGNEVVLNGAYALKLSGGSADQTPDGYHYHADGSLHQDH